MVVMNGITANAWEFLRSKPTRLISIYVFVAGKFDWYQHRVKCLKYMHVNSLGWHRSTIRIYKENAVIAAGILRKWSSSKGLSKARLMDTQRYTRKVKTCEKDLAKAKENLDKWGATSSTYAALQNGGTGSSSLAAPKEETSPVIETSVNQASSSITTDALNGDSETKQEKSEFQLVVFDALIIALCLTIRHISCLYLRFARQDR